MNSIRLYKEIGHQYGDPAWETAVPELRLSSRTIGNSDCKFFQVGAYLVDSGGAHVLDVDHDPCWAFRMEIVATSQTILQADWMEVTGVVTKFADSDVDPLAETWECNYCSTHEGESPHRVRERYVPNNERDDLIGLWAVVRVGS